MTDSDVVSYRPHLGPWRAGSRYDQLVIVGSPSMGWIPCTPGSAAVMFFLLTDEYPNGQVL